MIITNSVYSASIGCPVNLRQLCYRLVDVRYDPGRFPGLIWQHKTIGGNCLVFSNGVINCNGKVSNAREGYQRLRQYARRLQKLGYPVVLTDVKWVTLSASHTLSTPLNLRQLAEERPNVTYEPELFPSANFKVDGVNFCCFHSGKVVLTGIKSMKQIDDVVYPTLIELELYTV